MLEPTESAATLTREEIRAIRAAAKLSQSQAAKLCGVSKNTWARWERGEVHPSATARKLVTMLPQLLPKLGARK